MRKTTTQSERADDTLATASESMEILDALAGFCLVEKRSATLDGSIPTRAARGCVPFTEGNAAGFQLRLEQPALLRVAESTASIAFTDETLDRLSRDLSEAVDRLVASGHIDSAGPWLERLRMGLAVQDGDVLSFWTGLLVRPASGLWALLTSAFNRRSRIAVHECAIVDDQRFVPVVLDIDLASLTTEETWLDAEIGCLTPIRPDVRFTVHTIEEMPSVGVSFNEFYDRRYLEKREGRSVTGFYRREWLSQPDDAAPGGALCQLVGAGPQPPTTSTFTRYATAVGVTSANPTNMRYEFGVVRNQAEVRGRWDGQTFRDVEVDHDGQDVRFLERWRALYGEVSGGAEYFARYANWAQPPFQGEPHLMLTPWVFAATPRGWSSITEGFPRKGFDPLRGVLSTDWFSSLGPLFQFWEPRSFKLEAGEAIERVLPVPRSILKQPAVLLRTDRVDQPMLVGARDER